MLVCRLFAFFLLVVWLFNRAIIETTAPDGYIRNTHRWPVTIEGNPDGSIVPVDIGTLENHQGKIRMTKTDSDTTNSKPLEGAEFTLTDPDGVETVYITDANGQFEIYGLKPGNYILVETKAPEGYALTSDEQEITIPAEHPDTLPMRELTMTNLPLVGSIQFRKADKDTGTGLPGAVFQVIDKKTGLEVNRVTTGTGGEAQVDNLPPGEYSLVEVSAPTGYVRSTMPWDFTIEAEADGSIAPMKRLPDLENGQGKFSLRKVDENRNPLPGAIFTLTRSDGTVVGTYRSDAAGMVTIYQLAPGTYRVQETQAPRGYALTSDPFDFTIPDSYDDRILPALSVGSFMNERQQGLIYIKKIDVDTGATLPGAMFRIIRLSDGVEVGRVTTEYDGIASIGGLASGRYRVEEVSAPAGYYIDSSPVTVEITDDAQTAPIEVVMRDRRIPNWPSSPPPVRPTVPPGGPPKTGDMGNGPWIMLMAVSAVVFFGAMATLVVHDRKKKKERP